MSARERDRGTAAVARGGMRPGGRDRGAASILVLAIGFGLVAAGLTGAAVGSARVARHQARNAADLGALAGAAEAIHGEPTACERAGHYVTANGARLTRCAVDGLEIVVEAEVAVHPMPGMVRHANAKARAGPVYVVGEATAGDGTVGEATAGDGTVGEATAGDGTVGEAAAGE